MWKYRLRLTRQAIGKDPKGVAIIVLGWLFLATVFVIRGGPLYAFVVITGVGLLLILIASTIERALTGKEYYSLIGDYFSQDRLLPLIDELRARGIEVEPVEMPFKEQETFQPLFQFESCDHVAYLRLASGYVDAVHIGNWIGIKPSMETFYLDFAVECEIRNADETYADLDMRRRFLFIGKRRYEWRGGALADVMNRDRSLRERLPSLRPVMGEPGLFIYPSVEDGLVRIHIPDVKRVDAKQFPSILAVAERIAQHVKSLA